MLRKVLLAVSLCAFLLALLAGQALAASDEPAVVMKQVSVYFGAMTTKVCKKGVRADAGRLILIVPDSGDRIIFLNRETKCYAIQRVNTKQKLHLPNGAKLNPYNLQKSGALCGIKVNWYEHDSNIAKGVVWHYASAMAGQLPTNEAVASAMASFCLLPVGQGMPLFIERTNADGVVVHVLNTSSVKKGKVLLDELKVPKDYNRISTVVAVFAGRREAARDKDLNQWFKSEPEKLQGRPMFENDSRKKLF